MLTKADEEVLDILAETETQAKINSECKKNPDMTGIFTGGEDPRKKNIEEFKRLCNRFGFQYDVSDVPPEGRYWHPVVKLDDEFFLKGQGDDSETTTSRMYGVRLCRKTFDGKVKDYSLEIYQDSFWVQFVQDWKLIKREILKRIEKKDIIDTLILSLQKMRNEIDLLVKEPESKEQKYDWMMAIEKAKKMLEE